MDLGDALAGQALAPSKDSSLNSRCCDDQGSKKRKRQDEEVINPFFLPFTACKLQSNLSQSPISFTPIAHLPRADLPLTWLNYTETKASVRPGSLFQMQLENVHRTALEENGSLLVARLCPNGGLYAIERAGSGVYIACRLQLWVTERRVIDATLGVQTREEDLLELLARSKELASRSFIGPSTKNAGDVSLKPRTPRKPKDRRGARALSSILPMKEYEKAGQACHKCQADETTETLSSEGMATKESTSCCPPNGSQQTLLEIPLQTGTPGLDVAIQTAGSNSEQEMATTSPPQLGKAGVLDLDQLRRQYLETLYLSKTSLAYLVKGPLARARNQCQSGEKSATSMVILQNFYRESIVSSKKLDLKYRESINARIAAAATASDTKDNEIHAEDEETGPANPKKRPCRKKKRMGKDSLYPSEGEYIDRWWQEREISNDISVSPQTHAQEQRRLLSDLRMRETKMQILLILEVFMLETIQSAFIAEDLPKDPNVKVEDAQEQTKGVPTKTPMKTKKPELSGDLDTLIDRLCIWHTVGADILLASPGKKDEAEQTSSAKSKDQLREFCADVIIPFYASRLPDRCKAICSKLGGPELSPQRPKAVLTRLTTSLRLPPGAAIKSRPQAVARRTLERVLSEDQNMRHTSPPVLSRSSTAPVMPKLKREPSDLSQRPGSRGALHKTVSFSNREIDLVADAKVKDAKRQKLVRLAEQKKELDAAITALKKPNRTVAGQSLMDEMERRSAEKSLGRRSIHINATPKRTKPRASANKESGLRSSTGLEIPTDEHVIPSSSVRPQFPSQSSSQARSSAMKRAVLFAIHETPSRPVPEAKQITGKPISRLSFGGATEALVPTVIHSTPATNRLGPDLFAQFEHTPHRMTKSMKPVLFTPLKKAEVRIEDAFRDAPVIPEKAGKAMDRVMGGASAAEMSIYDSLGWDDDYDL